MSRVQRNRARLGLILTLGVVAYLSLPLAPFLIGAIFLLLITALVAAGVWYERAVDVETENVSLQFAVAGLEVDNAELIRENDSLLDRLSEVLDEHALCPAPVDEVAPTKRATGGVVQAGTVTIIGEGRKVPLQRKGGKS